MFAAILVLLITWRVSAVPSITFPINAQVPPVARVSKPYNFQFSPSTFTSSDGSALQYALQDAPSWLSINSDAQIFYGTPTSTDTGSPTFSLIASDDSGSTTAQVTFVVLNAPGPTTAAAVTPQLANFGVLCGPSSLAMLPSESFNIDFAPDTFVTTSNVSYYAISANRSPLPAWMNFDAATLAFTGVTPPLISYPQTYGIQLIASDVIGFAGAVVDFELVVSDHRLAFNPFQQNVNITKGGSVDFDMLQSQLLLDGSPIQSQDIQNASATTPAWLKFDPTTFTLSGDAPSGTTSQNVTITVGDIFGDVANAVVHFYFESVIFTGELGVLNATIGAPFKYSIARSLFVSPVDAVSVNLGATGKWLEFDPNTLGISGFIPPNTQPGLDKATITARSGADSQTQTFEIHLETKLIAMGSSTIFASRGSHTGPMSTSSMGAGSQRENPSGSGGLTSGEIAAAVIFPVLVLMALILLIAYCLRRRYRNKQRRSPSIKKSIIGEPIIQDPEIGVAMAQVIDPVVGDINEGSAVTGAPQLETQIPQTGKELRISKYRKSATSSLGDGAAAILENFNRSSWGYAEGGQNRRSGKYPSGVPRHVRDGEASKRYSKRSSRQSQQSSGLPINRRLTGLGHGRGGPGAPGRAFGSTSSRPGWDGSSYGSFSTQSTGLLSASPSAFPVPPETRRHFPALIVPEDSKRKSIRLVKSADEVDPRPMSEKRQSYIRNRASSINPFFASINSRTSVQSKRATGALVRSFSGLSDIASSSRNKVRSMSTTYSQSSSVEPPLKNPKRLNSSFFKQQAASQFPRVVSEPSQPSIESSDKWETADSSSYYSGEEEEDDGEFELVEEAADQRAGKRSKWSQRLGRDVRGQVVETRRLSQARRSRLGATEAPLQRLSSGSQKPRLVDIKGKRPVSVGTAQDLQLQKERRVELGVAGADFGFGESTSPSHSLRGTSIDRGNAAFL